MRIKYNWCSIRWQIRFLGRYGLSVNYNPLAGPVPFECRRWPAFSCSPAGGNQALVPILVAAMG